MLILNLIVKVTIILLLEYTYWYICLPQQDSRKWKPCSQQSCVVGRLSNGHNLKEGIVGREKLLFREDSQAVEQNSRKTLQAPSLEVCKAHLHKTLSNLL